MYSNFLDYLLLPSFVDPSLSSRNLEQEISSKSSESGVRRRWVSFRDKGSLWWPRSYSDLGNKFPHLHLDFV
jgi:hypothetical protein